MKEIQDQPFTDQLLAIKGQAEKAGVAP